MPTDGSDTGIFELGGKTREEAQYQVFVDDVALEVSIPAVMEALFADEVADVDVGDACGIREEGAHRRLPRARRPGHQHVGSRADAGSPRCHRDLPFLVSSVEESRERGEGTAAPLKLGGGHADRQTARKNGLGAASLGFCEGAGLRSKGNNKCRWRVAYAVSRVWPGPFTPCNAVILETAPY